VPLTVVSINDLVHIINITVCLNGRIDEKVADLVLLVAAVNLFNIHRHTID
jgi:hypothetical protein